jgi:hypothetical protein
VSNLKFRFQNETAHRGGTDEAASRWRLLQRDKETCCVQAACHMHALPVSMQKDCQGGASLQFMASSHPTSPWTQRSECCSCRNRDRIRSMRALAFLERGQRRGASALKLLNRLHTRFRKKCWTLHRSVAVALCTHLGEGDTGGSQLFNGSGSYCNCTVCSTVRTPVEPCG